LVPEEPTKFWVPEPTKLWSPELVDGAFLLGNVISITGVPGTFVVEQILDGGTIQLGTSLCPALLADWKSFGH
jgi:hypothetical protein